MPDLHALPFVGQRPLGRELGFFADTILHGSPLEELRGFPRFFYYDGRLAPTLAEAERQKAEVERQKAEASEKRASEVDVLNSELRKELAALKAELSRTLPEAP